MYGRIGIKLVDFVLVLLCFDLDFLVGLAEGQVDPRLVLQLPWKTHHIPFIFYS